MSEKVHEPIHPGEILLEEFLGPLNLNQYALARAIDVPPRRINEIVHGKRRITADTGLRLSRALGVSDGFWVGLQTDYDTQIALDKNAEDIDAIKPLVA